MIFSAFDFLLSIFLILLLKTIFQYIKNRELYKKAALIPGPRAIPLFGNLHQFYSKKISNEQVLREMYDLYPSPFRFWLGRLLYVAIYDPEQLQIVLRSTEICEKPPMYKFFQPYIGNGLFVAPVPIWKPHRKLLLSAFTTSSSQFRNEIYQKHAMIMANNLSDKENNQEFDVMKYTYAYSLNTFLEGVMGDNVILGMDDIEKYIKISERVMKAVTRKMIYYGFWSWKDFTDDVTHYRNFVNEVFQRKKKTFIERMNKEISETSNRPLFQKSFADILFESTYCKKEMTEEELQDEFKTILFGSTDSTAISASFTMLLLASFPDIQEKVRQELYQILGDTDSQDIPITSKHLCAMDYLERVIKESLRLFPIVPTIYRNITKDFNIGEQTLPKGSTLMISIFHIHRHKKLWDNPLKFDPDRFLPEEISKQHKMAYLPFSAGPRNCIGYKSGMTSMKILLSTILRKYVLVCDNYKPIEKIKLRHAISLSPAEPIKIKFIQINSRGIRD